MESLGHHKFAVRFVLDGLVPWHLALLLSISDLPIVVISTVADKPSLVLQQVPFQIASAQLPFTSSRTPANSMAGMFPSPSIAWYGSPRPSS